MQLAEVTGETVPESAMDSSATISEYINAKRGKQDSGMGGGQGGFSDSSDAKPSTKQLNFALFLALQNKVGPLSRGPLPWASLPWASLPLGFPSGLSLGALSLGALPARPIAPLARCLPDALPDAPFEG